MKVLPNISRRSCWRTSSAAGCGSRRQFVRPYRVAPRSQSHSPSARAHAIVAAWARVLGLKAQIAQARAWSSVHWRHQVQCLEAAGVQLGAQGSDRATCGKCANMYQLATGVTGVPPEAAQLWNHLWCTYPRRPAAGLKKCRRPKSHLEARSNSAFELLHAVGHQRRDIRS